MNIQRHLLITLTSQIVGTLQGIVIMPLVIRLGGLSVYGASVVWPNALAFLFAASYFGVGYSYRRKIASAHSTETRRTLFSPQFTYQLIALTIICSAGALVGVLLPKRIYDGDPPISLLALWLGVHFLFFQTQEYFRNTFRFDYFNLINILCNLLSIASILSWSLLRRSVSLSDLLLLTTIAKALSTFPWLVLLVSELGLPHLLLPIDSIRDDIRSGWPLFLDYVSYNFLTFGDRYLITIFLSISAVGIYQPGYQLAFLLIFVPRCGDILLPPLLARLVDSNNRSAAERVTSEFLNIFLFASIPYIVGAAFLGPSIIAFLSQPAAALASRWVTPLVVLGTLMYGVTLFYYQIAYVLGRMRYVIGANALGAILNIALNIILLAAARSITAAAIACLISYTATTIYITLALRPEWQLRPDWSRIARYILSALAMGCALWVAGFKPLTVKILPLQELLLYIGSASVLYLSIAWSVGALKFTAISKLSLSHQDDL